MTVTAPYSQYRKTNLKIGIVMLVVAAAWFAYDGFYNEKFKAKHTIDGQPNPTLVFHRKSPPYLFAGGVVLLVLFLKLKNKKLVADDQQLIFSQADKISYEKIESVNKTNYDSRGFFVIDYKGPDNQDLQRKISNRTYDNLDAVVEVIVSKITG